MAPKLTTLFSMAFFVLVIALAAASPAAACSGDDCGCYIERDACLAECPPPEDPVGDECRRGCIRESTRCAVCCCCECYFCPHYCGYGPEAADDTVLVIEPLILESSNQCMASSPGEELFVSGCAAAAEAGVR